MLTRHYTSGASPYEAAYGFSRAIRVGNRILVSGTAPIEELGGTAADVVRTRMFITDPADADAVGAVHGEIFGEVRPAATMVVISALLRAEWRIEIEAEALVGDDPA